MLNKILALFCAITFTSVVIAQEDKPTNTPFDKKHFKDKADDLKIALHHIKLGNKEYEFEGFAKRKALKHYLEAHKFNSNNAELNFKIGVCYFSTPEYEKAIDFLKKAYELDENVFEDVCYQIGYAFQLNEEWKTAISWYKKYENKILKEVHTMSAKRLAWQISDTDKRIEECKNGITYSSRPKKVKIKNLGDSINTPYPEYGMVMSADEEVMMFTSMRPKSEGHEKTHNLELHFLWEDVFVSYNKGNNEWTKAKKLPIVNSELNDATIALSPDGEQLIVYRDEDSENGDLYISKKVGSNWSPLEPMHKHINSPYQETSASFSHDGKKLYFVSNNPDDNIGGHDIFVSEIDPKTGDWGKAVNLGPTINTVYDEHSVFIHPNGKTLYFSSAGHSSMGGLDIFKSDFNNGKWSKPENIGYPINGPHNDMVMIMSPDGQRGYYSSFRHEGLGEEDIFLLEFIQEKKEQLTLVTGYVVDALSKDSIQANVQIIDVETNEVITTVKSNEESGKFLVSLPAGKNYAIIIEKEGFVHHSMNFNVANDAEYAEVSTPIYLRKVLTGSSVVLNNVFFEYNASTVKKESRAELDKVVDFLNVFPEIKVEISGHTDNKGSKTYNKKLSQARAKSVVDYLVAHGVDEKRLKYKGYGFDRPIAKNDTEEGRAKNRRTEMSIIKDGEN